MRQLSGQFASVAMFFGEIAKFAKEIPNKMTIILSAVLYNVRTHRQLGTDEYGGESGIR